MYFRDYKRGILIVSPTDGVQRLLIPTTGTMTGDGGPITSATLRLPLQIALDYQNRILVWDYDRIRRIDTNVSPMTISTVIGGGSTTPTDSPIDPLQMRLTNSGITYSSESSYRTNLVPLPNGDIYFQSSANVTAVNSGYRIRVYKAALNQVHTIKPTGIGDSYDANQDIARCTVNGWMGTFDMATSQLNFLAITLEHYLTSSACPGTGTPGPSAYVSLDPTTGAAIGVQKGLAAGSARVWARNGDLYFINRASARITRYDYATNTTIPVVGSGVNGVCADGTAALSCAIDPQSAFVTAQGQIYFTDRGRIRTVDQSGNVITLMGQSFYFGDGGHPLSARFNVVNAIEQLNSGDIIVLDQQEKRFRQFSIDGVINTIAGTGREAVPNTTSLATTQPIDMGGGGYVDFFKADPITGDVYFSRANTHLAKLNRSTGMWSILAGGGSTDYFNPAADGLLGTAIRFAGSVSYVPKPIGWDGSQLLIQKTRALSNGALSDYFFKLYSGTNGTQAHLAGTPGAPAGSLCVDGTATASCTLPAQGYIANYDSVGARWLIFQGDTTTIRTFPPGGTVGTLTTLPNATRAFAYRNTGSTPAEIVYYCSNTDKKLHKYDLTTDFALPWPIASLQCTGRSLIYNSSRNSLIFIYTQDDMYGIAEYLNP
jgi:hypothetical protein